MMIGKAGEDAGMGRVVLKLGDNVSTDEIYPGRYMATVLPGETPQYAFADSTEFSARLKNGQIPHGSFIIAGLNFGCGSSREQAVSTLKGHGLVVLARSFARIFLQNAVNLGLQVFMASGIEAEEGHDLRIFEDKVVNESNGKSFPLQPLAPAKRAIIAAGGLIPYTRERLLKNTQNE